MLWKLFKYDLKCTYGKLLYAAAASPAVTALIAILRLQDNSRQQESALFIWAALGLFAALLAGCFFLAKYYSDSLFEKSAYLTRTIPAQTNDLIFSKLAVMLLWLNIIFLLGAGALLLIFGRYIHLNYGMFFTRTGMLLTAMLWLCGNLLTAEILILIFTGFSLTHFSRNGKKPGLFIGPAGLAVLFSLQYAGSRLLPSALPLSLIFSSSQTGPSFDPLSTLPLFYSPTVVSISFSAAEMLFHTAAVMILYLINVRLLEKYGDVHQ